MKMKATSRIFAAFAVLAVLAVSAGFAVNIKGAIVDATAGYTFNGAAPNGHVLCGNGSEYVDASSCGASANYQTMQSNGTPLTQRADLNFSTDFTLSDTSPSTTVTLAVPITSLCQTSGTHCPPVSGTLTDVTGSRSFGATFTNSGTTAIFVSGFGVTTTGGDTSQIDCTVGGIPTWGQQANATIVGGHTGFSSMVPPGATYECVETGTTAVTLGKWTEFVF